MTPVKAFLRVGLRAVKRIGRSMARLRRWPSGRAASTTRPTFIAEVLAQGQVLEIGPFDCPQIEGTSVAYFDVLDRTGLMARALEHGRSPDRCPPIDYVSPTGDLAIVDRQFDAVFSSHVIEHQPDLIAHLVALQHILRPGGHVYLIVPDRRFCFDYYIAETTITEVIEANLLRARFHSAGAILRHRLLTTHNNSVAHWLGLHGRNPVRAVNGDTLNVVLDECARSASGQYVDVHAWYFTPAGFADLIDRLRLLGLIQLESKCIHATGLLEQEFFAVLRKPDHPMVTDRAIAGP